MTACIVSSISCGCVRWQLSKPLMRQRAQLRAQLLLALLLRLPGSNGGGDITISAGGSMNVFAGESISLTCGGGAGRTPQGDAVARAQAALGPGQPSPPPTAPPATGRRRMQQAPDFLAEGAARGVAELISEMRARLGEMEVMLVAETRHQSAHVEADGAELLAQMEGNIEEVRQMVLSAEAELHRASLSAPADSDDAPVGAEGAALAAAREVADTAEQASRLQLTMDQLVAKEQQLERQQPAAPDRRPRREPAPDPGAVLRNRPSTVPQTGPPRPRRPPVAPQPPPKGHPGSRPPPAPPPPAPPPPSSPNKGSAAAFVQTEEWNLIAAASDGNQQMLAEALRNGADIDVSAPHQNSCTVTDFPRGVSLRDCLRVQGEAPDGVRAEKRTALIAAVSRGRLGCARLLLARGASLSVGGDNTPLLAAAAMLGASGIPAGLPKPSKSPTGLSSSTTSAWTAMEMVWLLLDASSARSAGVGWGNQRTKEGFTALHLLGGAGTISLSSDTEGQRGAGSAGRSWGPKGLRELTQVVSTLLLGSENGRGQRALHVDARARGGRTALMEAARSSQPAVTQIFLSLGADPTVRDDGGETAFHYALTALTDELESHTLV